MSKQPVLHYTAQPIEAHQSPQSETEVMQTIEQSVPIEVKWGLPAWMLRHPGPRIEVEDDDVAFEEG